MYGELTARSSNPLRHGAIWRGVCYSLSVTAPLNRLLKYQALIRSAVGAVGAGSLRAALPSALSAHLLRLIPHAAAHRRPWSPYRSCRSWHWSWFDSHFLVKAPKGQFRDHDPKAGRQHTNHRRQPSPRPTISAAPPLAPRYPFRGKVAEILRLLQQDGWILVAQRGSHRQSSMPASLAASLCPASPATTWRPALRTAS